ncbi:hypothetical protein ACXYTJ_10200 [Gilvimarinus sp. F26214L]
MKTKEKLQGVIGKKGTELFFNSALPVGQQEAQNGDKIFSPQNAWSQ